MTDNVKPIRDGVFLQGGVKQQMLDTFAQTFDKQTTAFNDEPVACLMIFVGKDGGAITQWLVEGPYEHQASLYLARASQVAQIDLHNLQKNHNHDCD